MTRGTALLAAVLALSGCTGSLFKTALSPPALYLLNATPAGTAGVAPELPGDLAVLKPQVRAGLDSDRIAALYPDQHLDYYADARWSGPLDEVLQELATQVLQARAGLRNVGGDSSAFASSYWLEISVVDFQAEYGAAGGVPVVHVHLQARLGRSADRRILARFEADARQPATDNRLRAVVQAYNQAANEALGELAARSTDTLAGELKAR